MNSSAWQLPGLRRFLGVQRVAEIKADVLQIERLRLAAWMRLNGQRLLARHLEGDGRVIYLFERSQITDELMRQWEEKAPRTLLLSRFSSIVLLRLKKRSECAGRPVFQHG